MRKLLMFILLLLPTTLVYADNCERPQNAFDSLYCARKIFFQLDDDLNKTYAQLKTKLTKNQKTILTRSQKLWIKDRNYNCTYQGAVYVSCAVDKTRQRLTFLQNRLYECKSVGCMSSKLSKVTD